MTTIEGPPIIDMPSRKEGQIGVCVARVSDAIVTLDGRKVLNRVTLTLHRGEIYVLLGPNGAGKTSLIRTLCGRLPLEHGKIEVGAALEDPRQSSRALRSIGYVPQSIALFPRLTVRENLKAFSRFSDVNLGWGTLSDLLNVTRLSSVADTVVTTLSGGLQRRVNIAVALVTAPELLLMDEPTVGIDLQARSAIHQVLIDLRDRGITILLITHDFDQAERLADKVGFMNSGKIILEGHPGNILRQAFGSRRQIDVVLTDPAPDGVGSTLRALGLEPTDGRLLWRGLTDEERGMPQLLEQLQSGNVPLREVRIREPGLDMLFHRVTGP